jgi:hypothetical protein
MKMMRMILGAVALLAPLGLSAVSAATTNLNDFASCAVKKDRAAVVRAVRDLPLSSDAAQIAPGSLSAAADCAGGAAVDGRAMLLRGAVAQALYRADFREVGMPPRTPTRNFADLGWPAIGEKDPVTDPGVALFKLADCVVRNDSELVDALLRYSFGSDGAKRMIDRLEPRVRACYPKGASITANRETLHAAIAQAAYYIGVRYWNGQMTGIAQK